ncbi:bestrophin family protein [Oceanobacter mangrovi]|uniref:bestrophin family protein n=1 Tax=Oceanobacter mangrovi TaxID=2862510 RepID=UPI001C8EC896|nr:bestrophin family ion channel [Oceanobacter mangrovi]
MIVRERPNALALLLVLRGSVLNRIFPHLAVLMMFTAAVVELHGHHIADMARYSIAPFTLLGIALSLFLGFRNNACYDRWWEGRKHWGAMVVDVRSLARSCSTLIGDTRDREQLMYLIAAHYHALRGQLRREPVPEEVGHYLSLSGVTVRTDEKGNSSDRYLAQAGRLIGQWYRDGKLDSVGVSILDARISSLAFIQGSCERLAATPLPFAYTLLSHRTAYLYCYLLPFGLVGTMGWMTLVFTVIVAYTFWGLDALAEELETPFADKPNHLPLTAMCRVNDISIAEALGLPVPDRLEPVDHILR